MLFYNHKQEFIGIDEEGLKLLNYPTLEELLEVCSDVADLFANEPGYIHNFKSFGWIDFLLHADSDSTGAIVHANGRTFSCTLGVAPLYLCSEPKQNGYIIEMLHVKSISGDEIKPYVSAPKPPPVKIEQPVAEAAPAVSKEFVEPEEQPAVPKTEPLSTLPDYASMTPTQLSEPSTLDVPYGAEEIDDRYAKLVEPLSEEELGYEEALPEPLPEISEAPSKPIVQPMIPEGGYTKEELAYLSHLKINSSYQFDPRIAANELGLPVDLIEEFIGDFIQQSYDFKEELFQAASKGDISNLRILSHKLKGVAANLRIEDAFETLSIINTSDDLAEIEANLKYFYSIVNKLEGKGEAAAPVAPAPQHQEKEAVILDLDEDSSYETEKERFTPSVPLEETDDIYAFSLKQDDDEPLIVQPEEIGETEYMEEPVALPEKEYLELQDTNGSPLSLEVSGDAKIETVSQEAEDSKVETAVQLHYDRAKTASALGIELSFFEELLHDFQKDTLRESERISAAINAFDTQAWNRIALDLKGISDNLRMNEISDELAILATTHDAQEAKKASIRLNRYIEQL